MEQGMEFMASVWPEVKALTRDSGVVDCRHLGWYETRAKKKVTQEAGTLKFRPFSGDVSKSRLCYLVVLYHSCIKKCLCKKLNSTKIVKWNKSIYIVQ